METSEKFVGYGDCAPLPEAGTEVPAEAEKCLRSALVACLGKSPEVSLAQMSERWWKTPAARCAIETSLLDLLSQEANLPLAHWLNEAASTVVEVNAVLGRVDKLLISRARDALNQQHKVLKVKVGIGTLDEELNGLHALASELPPESMLRLDANGSWNEHQAREFLMASRGMPVESLEEPLAVPDSDALYRLQQLADWPLALDESLSRCQPTGELLTTPPVRRLVLKPVVQGGLLPCLNFVRQAKRRGLECVVTSAMDSAAGVRAALQLAAAVDDGLAHGLSTGEWLKEDTGARVTTNGGQMHVGNLRGLGFLPSQWVRFE